MRRPYQRGKTIVAEKRREVLSRIIHVDPTSRTGLRARCLFVSNAGYAGRVIGTAIVVGRTDPGLRE